jgi:lipopolysaccharide biosynthesis glycosyltransferase
MSKKIDIAICYHKQSPVFQSDALKPMHVGKAISEVDLGFRGDDTGDNISAKNKWFAEETGFYWLWKNSDADTKGMMHYRRLLDLRSPNGEDKNIALEDIESSDELIEDLGLNAKNISAIMKDADVIIRKKDDIRDWFDGNIEEQYKACHIPEYLDYAMDIIKHDFLNIAPAAEAVVAGHFGNFTNLVIMKSLLFDAMCEFRYGVLEKLERMVDVNRPEIADGWQHTARYAGFVGERLTMFYIEYLRQQGQKIAEFPAVNIAPRGTTIWDDKNYGASAYAGKAEQDAIEPVSGKGAIAVMMAANNKYAPYAGVMLQSIIESANLNKNYDVLIVGSEITDKNKKMLESMGHPNVSVRVINISRIVGIIGAGTFYTHSHFTIETYYRFFIPKLFVKYDKVLYLDCDMVSLRDIADLYETNIGENWWGVVRENFISCLGFTDGTWEKHTFLPYMKDTLKMNSPFDYFQAGVMIWNVRACIKDDVMNKLLARLKEIGKPHYADQDVMSSLANGKHIHWLSQNWNVAWHTPFCHWKGEGTAAYKTAMHLLENPFILHYCSYIKPWIEPGRPNAHYFWKFARKTPFYEIILYEIIMVTVKLSDEKERKVKKLKKKARKYKILQVLTLGLVKSFRLRKNRYRDEIKQIEEIYALDRYSYSIEGYK